MLANLLPGLREIRAPLAVGYLFLISAWILLHDRVDLQSGASSTVTAVDQLKSVAGGAAFTAAMSFLAYLLGALWEPIAAAFERGVWGIRAAYLNSRSGTEPAEHRTQYRSFETEITENLGTEGRFITSTPKKGRPRYSNWSRVLEFQRTDPAKGQDEHQPPPEVRVSEAGWSQLWAVARRLFEDVDYIVRDQLRVSRGDDVTHATASDRDSTVSARAAFKESADAALALARLIDVRLTTESPDVGFVLAAIREHYPHLGSPAILGDLERQSKVLAENIRRERGFNAADKPDWRAYLITDALSSASEEAMGLIRSLYTSGVGDARDEWWINEAPELGEWYSLPHPGLGIPDWPPLVCRKESDEHFVRVVDIPSVARQVFRELPLSARRLVTEEQQLYLEVDRMQGEIDFRFMLALPTAAATAIVVLGLNLPLWASFACIALGIGAGTALMLDGWRRDRERNDLLIGLLAIGKAKSVTFERLRERAKMARAA